ncbi:hypothetical protein OOZ51_00310 [Arthrobacter sp. MI7-26]|uniref:hypothetical protein n=1 Tax=Arthrobacter sp. MI7-26 TaxID=2993653 RepID=UPI00224951BF|nr:hypothetical protein [Arthrobacter sp. MI7-26]MCX2746255.1 hypothetical protein [Arthrobacter sp. MI7-26]
MRNLYPLIRSSSTGRSPFAGQFTGSNAGVVSLQRVDEAAAVATPDAIGSGTWMEHGFDELAAEQEYLWPAEGEVASRDEAATANGLITAVEAEEFLLTEAASLVRATKTSYEHSLTTLLAWVHRGPHANFRYWVGWTVLGMGDTVGVAGASILLGEEIWIAVAQALATGLAAVTAGLAGHDLKELRLARQRRRDPDDLTDDERRYRRFFDDSSPGDSLLKIVAYLSGTIVLLIAVGIFALRASIEGGLAGLVFGSLAAATALASFMNSYAHADEVADLIAVARRNHQQSVRAYRRISQALPLRRRAEALEKAASIGQEHALRGQAAAHHVQAMKFQSLTANPGVVGHGPSSSMKPAPASAVGDGAQKPVGPVSRHRRLTKQAKEETK